MGTEGHATLAQRLTGITEVECVTADLNGVPRGKVMTAEGFLEGRRLQLARGVLLQCIMGGYPPTRFYGSDDGDLVLSTTPERVFRLPWSESPRAMAICDADELDGRLAMPSAAGSRWWPPSWSSSSSNGIWTRGGHSSHHWVWMVVARAVARPSVCRLATACDRSSMRFIAAWRHSACRATPLCMKWG